MIKSTADGRPDRTGREHEGGDGGDGREHEGGELDGKHEGGTSGEDSFPAASSDKKPTENSVNIGKYVIT